MSTSTTNSDEPWTPEPDDATFDDYHDDGVATVRHADRWQKHGKDRLYMGGDNDGHIDLKHGEMVDLDHYQNGVEYELSFCAEDECMYLWAEAQDEKTVRNSLSKKTRKEVARIPRSVMGWGNGR